HHHFVARYGAATQRPQQRPPQRSLRPLAPVVDGRVEQIDSAAERQVRDVNVALVVRIVALAEIRAQANRGDAEPVGAERTEVSVGEPVGEALGVARRSRRGGATDGGRLGNGPRMTTSRTHVVTL